MCSIWCVSVSFCGFLFFLFCLFICFSRISEIQLRSAIEDIQKPQPLWACSLLVLLYFVCLTFFFLRVTPACVLTLMVYKNFNHFFLPKRWQQQFRLIPFIEKKKINRAYLTALFLASKDNKDLSLYSFMKNTSFSLPSFPPALPVGSKWLYVSICKGSNKDRNRSYKRYLFAKYF